MLAVVVAMPLCAVAGELDCDGALPPQVDFRITYGPHWDGAWRLSAIEPQAGAPARLVYEELAIAPADYAVTVSATHQRPIGDRNRDEMRRAAGIMIAEMRRYAERDEVPETRDQRRPLLIEIAGRDGVMCTGGYADWPRIPGSYFFAAVELVREAVRRPDALRDPWSAVRLQLEQVRAPWE